MKNWLRQHALCLAATLGRLTRTPLASLLNVGVIGVALALPLAFYVVLANVQGCARANAPTPQLSLFLKIDAPAAAAREIEARLKKHEGIAKYRFIARDQALADLKASTGLADVIASLNRNPLPDGFVVDAKENSAAVLEKLRDEFKAWPGVEHVQLDSAWARRLDATLHLGRLIVLGLAALLAFALVAVTFNTIRLQMLTQRAEIEVAKMIGATNPFVRRPFLYYGALTGLLGAAVGWGIVWGGLRLLNDRLAGLGQLYDAQLRLTHLSLPDTLSLCLFAATLGWLGAWLSASRNLAELEE
ncbi:MAG: FtsX-like permease family protein [Betaproteobacteria bacterium]|nr:FtsX-like permease family protein [Betaproteobacteria bacterium]